MDAPDLSGVDSMNSMFCDTSFSANLSGWNVSSVTDTSRAFQGSSFNGGISGWDTSRVTDMYLMFFGAFLFPPPKNRQCLRPWHVAKRHGSTGIDQTCRQANWIGPHEFMILAMGALFPKIILCHIIHICDSYLHNS